MEQTFQPFDVVIGNDSAHRYGVTTTGTKWIVVANLSFDMLVIPFSTPYQLVCKSVRIFRETKSFENFPIDLDSYTVSPDCFDLVSHKENNLHYASILLSDSFY